MKSRFGTHKLNSKTRANTRTKSRYAASGPSSSDKIHTILTNPGREAAVLEAWARRDAAKDIAAANGGLTISAIYKIVEAAREAGDPRATFRNGSAAKGRALPGARSTLRAERREQRAAMKPSALLQSFGISKRTIFITRLGMGSADCLRVPVSVSTLQQEGSF